MNLGKNIINILSQKEINFDYEIVKSSDSLIVTIYDRGNSRKLFDLKIHNTEVPEIDILFSGKDKYRKYYSAYSEDNFIRYFKLLADEFKQLYAHEGSVKITSYYISSLLTGWDLVCDKSRRLDILSKKPLFKTLSKKYTEKI